MPSIEKEQKYPIDAETSNKCEALDGLPWGFLSLCLWFFVFLAKAHGTDYFFTQSAYFHEAGRVSFVIDFNQYLKQNSFGVNQYLLQELPLKVKATLVNNVQASITIPLVFGLDYLTAEPLSTELGNLEFELRFAADDEEYKYCQAYYFKYRVGTGPPTQKIEEPSQLSGERASVSYYPLASSLEEMDLGWQATKNIFPKTQFHLNLTYTYQLSDNQTITNLIGFEDIVNDNVETNARGGRLATTRVSLFGIDTSLRNLFWSTSLNDPWSDKKNDYFTLSMAIDTYIGTDYYFGRKKILLGLKPFVEFTWLIPFSDESFYHSRLLLVPGLFLKFTKHIRYLFGVGISLEPAGATEFKNTAFISLRMAI